MEEVRVYQDQLNKVLEDFSALLEEDRTDALCVTIQSWKWIMSRAWSVMAQANIDIVMKSIMDPACITLKKTLNLSGVEVVDPPEDVPTGEEFMRYLPDKRHKQEVCKCIMGVFDNLLAAHSHMSLAAGNMLLLAKIADEDTFNTILKAAICPVVQINIPEKYLKPMEDPKLKTTTATRLEKLHNMLLPIPDRACITCEPSKNVTRLLATAVWIKLRRRYLNEGYAKDAYQMFDIQAKQLSKVLLGKEYLGGSGQKKKKSNTGPRTQLKKHETRKSSTTVKRPEEDDDDEDEPPTTEEGKG